MKPKSLKFFYKMRLPEGNFKTHRSFSRLGCCHAPRQQATHQSPVPPTQRAETLAELPHIAAKQ